jgi:hypothetical protein
MHTHEPLNVVSQVIHDILNSTEDSAASEAFLNSLRGARFLHSVVILAAIHYRHSEHIFSSLYGPRAARTEEEALQSTAELDRLADLRSRAEAQLLAVLEEVRREDVPELSTMAAQKVSLLASYRGKRKSAGGWVFDGKESVSVEE